MLAALCVDFGPFLGCFWPILGHFGAILVPHQADFGVFEHNSGHVRVSDSLGVFTHLLPGPFQLMSAAQRLQRMFWAILDLGGV